MVSKLRQTSLFTRLRALLCELRTANRANVTVTFALATVPIVGFVGAAIDYSHANSVKTAMQAAADSTALMLSKTATSLTATQLTTQANSYFQALFTRPEATNVSVTATYTSTSGSQVVVNASSHVKASFMNLIGMSSMTVAVNSHVKWGSARLRVALVLDNTGSMADDGKLTALITATNNLLTMLKAAAVNPGDVYVSIIPFSRDVNVGASNYNATWIDWTQWSAPPDNVPSMSYGPGDSCPWSTRNDGYTCTTSPSNNDSNTSTIPSSGTYKGYICPGVDSNSGAYYNGCYNSTQYSSTGSSATCTGHSNCSCSGSGSSKTCKTNTNYYEHTWIPNNINTWNGCITDRGSAAGPVAGNYDENVTAPNTNNTGTLFPAEQYSYCTAATMSLNYNWTAMTALVNSMQANGNTNQAIGLAHGWQSLVGGGPYPAPPATDPNYTYSQVIILLTDGLNTQNRWYTAQSSIDARETGTCSNIKAAGITLYTVQVNTGGDPTSTLLQSCASDSSKFFLLTTASQIVTTFNSIGTALSNLRLSQ